MKMEKDNVLDLRLHKQYEEKYVRYLEKRYGKKRVHLFVQPSS